MLRKAALRHPPVDLGAQHCLAVGLKIPDRCEFSACPNGPDQAVVVHEPDGSWYAMFMCEGHVHTLIPPTN